MDDNVLQTILADLQHIRNNINILVIELETLRQGQRETSLLMHELSLEIRKRRLEKENLLREQMENFKKMQQPFC